MAEIAPINNNDRTPLYEKVPLTMPYAVYVFPTTFCNFKCVYCAHALGHDKMREFYNFEPQSMNMETYSIIVKQMKEFPRPVKLLSLTGQGEPLINSAIPDMVRMAKEKGVADRIEIITNGVLLTKQMADRLIDAGLDGLRVSLQGMSAAKYKEICGAEVDYDLFLSQLRYYYENKGKNDLFVKIMDVALDEGDEEQFYHIFNTIADRMYVEHCRPVYDGVAFTADMEGQDLDRYGNTHKHRVVCPLCFFQLGIFPNGDVKPDCTIYEPIILGNVQKDTLNNMWTGRLLKEFWLMQLHGHRSRNPKCAVCVAPDDVSHPLDELDSTAEEIIKRIGEGTYGIVRNSK